jgi:hypothetical protein
VDASFTGLTQGKKEYESGGRSSTFAKPFDLPAGIEKVFVNGELVWDAGKPTVARPGRVLPK